MDFRYIGTAAKASLWLPKDDKPASVYWFYDDNRVPLAKALEVDEFRAKKIGHARKCNKNGIQLGL